ncbi:hypothetical protein SAMN04488518_1362 [Pseudovibrio ascidiaceicola]|uniref:Uncharacterized protein n=1 Tax=Pseudovibrio ascidiaceicola TaxID=285279 RepID=A0A1I4G9W3_9HYPH|nr:hypothetical protein [Pseudovibrio ascidiaceicola]SFL26659.1 hypothetical protein SAMN04488518_1362 [Pseudovibrio ascidiaceicola]
MHLLFVLAARGHFVCTSGLKANHADRQLQVNERHFNMTLYLTGTIQKVADLSLSSMELVGQNFDRPSGLDNLGSKSLETGLVLQLQYRT